MCAAILNGWNRRMEFLHFKHKNVPKNEVLQRFKQMSQKEKISSHIFLKDRTHEGPLEQEEEERLRSELTQPKLRMLWSEFKHGPQEANVTADVLSRDPLQPAVTYIQEQTWVQRSSLSTGINSKNSPNIEDLFRSLRIDTDDDFKKSVFEKSSPSKAKPSTVVHFQFF